MNQQDVPLQQSGFHIEQADGETLLLHPERNESLYLNESATLIWALCDGARTIGDVEQLLVQQYPENKNSIPTELSTTIEQLVEHKALVLKQA